MKNQISPEIKDSRSKALIELSDLNEKDYLNEYIGKTVEVLFEEKEGDLIKGHTQNYILVKKCGNAKINNIEKVEINGAGNDYLMGI